MIIRCTTFPESLAYPAGYPTFDWLALVGALALRGDDYSLPRSEMFGTSVAQEGFTVAYWSMRLWTSAINFFNIRARALRLILEEVRIELGLKSVHSRSVCGMSWSVENTYLSSFRSLKIDHFQRFIANSAQKISALRAVRFIAFSKSVRASTYGDGIVDSNCSCPYENNVYGLVLQC